MGEEFDISVVISTYNRCTLLPAALDSLLAQKAAGISYEVIIVDNNSTDRTREVVEAYIAGGASNLRYVFEGRQGVSYGRNAGIRSARSAIIAFTDDDVCAAPEWVAALRRAFDEHPEVDFIGGKVLPQWESPPPSWLTTEHWSPLALVDYGDEPFEVDTAREVCLLTANAAFRREALEQVGMFAPDLQRVKDGIGSIEDQELIVRLCRAGRRGRYLPEIVVHAPVQSERLTKEYHRRWHRGHGYFYALMRDAQMERSRSRLFDVPAHLYKQALKDRVAWSVRALQGRGDDAFLYETRLCFFAGFFGKRRGEFLAGGERSTVREVARFVRALVVGREGRRMRNEVV